MSGNLVRKEKVFSNKRMTRESVRGKMSSKYTIFYHVNNYLNVEILRSGDNVVVFQLSAAVFKMLL